MSVQIPILDIAGCQRGVGVIEVETTAGKRQLPLAGVQITARVVDRIAEVRVRERFRNDFKEFLEAIYIFPLAGVVSAFEMRVGGRVIKGVVKERSEARRDYKQALEEGKRAALLEQERDDVFTVSVGNLPPGEEVTVELVYSEKLPYFEDGTSQLRLPLVVAPRYIPGSPLERDAAGKGTEHDTDIVPDASRITPPRLADGFDPKVDLSIEVDLLGQVSELSCSQHAVRTTNSEGTTRVSLARTDERLNRDFVLSWRLATEKLSSRLLVHRTGEESYGMLSILSPRRDGFLGVARDVVFVLDRSGSMGGVKMTSAARACAILLGTLGPKDRFAIQAFDDKVEWLERGRERLLQADEEGIDRGEKYLRTIDARGGTEMHAALKAALQLLDSRSKSSGRISVIVFITDGQVGNESSILKHVQKHIGDARVFTIGVDTAVNEAFLKRLAGLGGGTCTTVLPGTHLEDALQAVGREIGAPLAVELKADIETAPARIPDLFAGRAVTTFLRMGNKDRVRVKGKFTDGSRLDETIVAEYVKMPAIAQLWAKAKITELEDEYRVSSTNQAQLKESIVDLSVRHSVLTRFTAFVVVDDSGKVNYSDEMRSLVQPVETPFQWASPGISPSAPPYLAADATLVGGGVWNPDMMKRAVAEYQAQPAPKPTGLSGVINKVTSFLDRMKEAKPSRKPDVSEETVLSKIKVLAELLQKILAELKSGRVPEAESLETVRRELLTELAACPAAPELVELQSFLRSSAVELVSALSTPGVTANSLCELFEKRLLEFEKAKSKAVSRLEGGSSDSFWEQTI